MDANEYVLRVMPAAKSLGLTIRKAEWMGKGKAPAITTAASDSPLSVVEPEAIEQAEPPPSLIANLTSARPKNTNSLKQHHT